MHDTTADAPKQPSPSVTLRDRGDAARDRHEWSAAAAAYRGYLDEQPDDAAIHVQLGHVLKEGGALAAAVAAYRTAAALAPADVDVRVHLGHLLRRLGQAGAAASVLQEASRLMPVSTAALERPLPDGIEGSGLLRARGPARYLELRDLFQYLDMHATVTGITRVVLALVHHIVDGTGSSAKASCHFVETRDGLLRLVPRAPLRTLVRLATAERSDLPATKALIEAIRDASEPIELGAGDLYVIPGAFWEFAAEQGRLPRMKRSGVRVAPLLYDLIPVTQPHFCTAELTTAFRTALADTLPFYDFALTISVYVAAQLHAFLSAHRLPMIPTTAVPLAHTLRFAEAPSLPAPHAPLPHALEGRAFVLCVCTIEVRKNHQYLFNIWQRLIEDGAAIPDLVFVGRTGWRVGDLLAQIEASGRLGGRLHVLEGQSDATVAALYQCCLFTVFPSFAEGWGLPVGESLSYGKICVASAVSSIPEVGGDLAVYIDPFNLHSGYEVVRQLIAEPAYRAALEARIRAEFIPRTWQGFGDAFLHALGAAHPLDPVRPDPGPPAYAPLLAAGSLLDMHQSLAARLRRPDYIENPVRLIFTAGWRHWEASGTWMHDAEAVLRFRATSQAGQEVVVFLLTSASPWVTDRNTARAWIGTSIPTDVDVVLDARWRSLSQGWTRLKGRVDADGTVSVQFRVDGPIVPDRADAIPVALRLHAVGYAASDDGEARASLLEQMALGVS